jgi:hypothetical protein
VSTLAEVRAKVRTQVDLDDEDLPDLTLDAFIREAFDRTFAAERRWPFFEYTWALTKSIGLTTIALPVDPEVAFIQRLRNSDNMNLTHLAQQLAEDNFEGVTTTGTPEFFSLWGDVVNLWPTPDSDTEYTYTMRGFRKPTWTGVASDELDGDERLHNPIAWHAVALAYAQLEDPEMEAVYMQRWGAALNEIRKDLMRAQYQEPIILNGGKRQSWRRLVQWNT